MRCECEHQNACGVCQDKREMAQSLANAVLRMKLAVLHNDNFVFKREAQDLGDRILWEQWAYVAMNQRLGFEWEAL